MKNLLRKEHYCFKIHTLVMKNSAYLPPFVMTLEFHMSIKHVFSESYKSPRLLPKNLQHFYGSQKAVFSFAFTHIPR